MEALKMYFAAVGRPLSCPIEVTLAWDAECRQGDIDGDGAQDIAVLLLTPGPLARAPDPGSVVAWLSGEAEPRRIAVQEEADASELGRAFFDLADRTGDGRADVVMVAAQCTTTSCAGQVQVWSWDGMALRDAGPGRELAVTNLIEARWEREGGASVLITNGGKLEVAAAGPTRNVHKAYISDGARYVPIIEVPEAPEYLYHAVLDADAAFDAGEWERAIELYRAVIGAPQLKDWKEERGGQPGRAHLEGYARLRIAIATSAGRQDPTAALDETILNHPATIWGFAAETFRNSYLQGGEDVPGACRAVTAYLATPPIPESIRAIFDYGYANPVKTFTSICEL